ncbi:MAG: hypothetical protein R3E66_08955 [bacterium]
MRAAATITAIYGVAAVACCFVPLFQVVGYESAALFGVLAGFAGVLWPTLGSPPLSVWWNRLWASIALLCVPLGVLSLNAVRVLNCSPGLGYLYWFLIPGVSIAVATSFRVLVDQLPWSARRRTIAATVMAVFSIVAFGWQLAMQPPINGFQLFLGYFSGSIYDEALGLPDGLVFYRAWCLAFAVTLVVVAEARYRWRNWLPFAAVSAVAAILIAATVLGWQVRREFGVDHDRETIAERLGGRIETEHFEIYFPATRQWYERSAELAEDHEFRYAQMHAFFGTDPVALRGRKVRSFVYGDRDQKGQMMGGRRTLVAKLWLGEMHILWRDYGDHLLAHELAHIFTEPFGAGPLRLSSRFGVGVNMGLVEGIATAADWPSGDLNVHTAAAALRRLNAAPDIRGMLGASGFWTQSSSRAYTLMGSFIRYLVDTHGIDKLKQAYPNGDFEGAYGEPVDALVAQWETFVDGIDLSDRDMARARFQYDRPSIFEKICARTVAELRRQAEDHARLGERDAGVAAWEAILGFDPANVRYRLEYASFLTSVEMYEEAEREVKSVLDAQPSDVEKAIALEMMGDIYWRRGDPSAAQQQYRTCMTLGVPNDQLRMLQVKDEALDRVPAVVSIAFDYLLRPEVDLGAYQLQKWLNEGDDPLAHYLLARRLFAARQYVEALEHLKPAIAGLQSALLVQEATLLAVEALYFSNDYAAAQSLVNTLGPEEPYVTLAGEWKQRIAWARRNRLEGR